MVEADRKRFMGALERLCVVHDRRIDGDSLGKLTAAYWHALRSMSIDVFEAACDRAIETTDRFPRPATLWAISKEGRQANRYQTPDKPPFGDALYGWANRKMFAWLRRYVRLNGRMSEAKLQEVVAAKNDNLEILRGLMAEKDPEATGERFVTYFERQANAIAERREAA